MRKAWFGLALVGTVLLAGCSAAPAENMFTPPGAELAGAVVEPPAELPPAIEVETPDLDPNASLASCNPVQSLNADALKAFNGGTSRQNSVSPSVSGEVIVSGASMTVQTDFQKVFSYLIKAELNSGKTVWFGSSGDVNEYDVYSTIFLDAGRGEPIFGATPETYTSFLWGKAGAESSLVAHGVVVVDNYEHCFLPAA